MHSVLFSVKRAFHKSHWFGRDLLDPLALTPSRFDILYILKNAGLPSVWQSKIRKILGIAGPTLGRMIKALLQLGFIARRASDIDRRQLDISLTARGLRVVRCAIEVFIESGVIQESVERFLCATPERPDAAFGEVARMDDLLRFMRRRLGDRATLHYPWHPDD